MARALVGADAQLATAEGRVTHAVQLVLGQVRVDRDEGEGLQDVDLADVGAGDAALVGEGADDRAGHDAVAVADLDAVDGAGPLGARAAAAGGTGLAVPVVTVAAVAAALAAAGLEGGGHEGALGVDVLLATHALALAAVLLVVAAARALVADGEGQERRGEVLDAQPELLAPGGDELGVHAEAAALVAGGGLLEEPAGAVA